MAAARGITVDQVAVVAQFEKGRDPGFLGAPRVSGLPLDAALDRAFPYAGQ